VFNVFRLGTTVAIGDFSSPVTRRPGGEHQLRMLLCTHAWNRQFLAVPLRLRLSTAGGLNFVFILIDDLGWRDLGVQGSRFYETPNIDRLHPRACASRISMRRLGLLADHASILTGRYPYGLVLPIDSRMAAMAAGKTGPEPTVNSSRSTRMLAEAPDRQIPVGEYRNGTGGDGFRLGAGLRRQCGGTSAAARLRISDRSRCPVCAMKKPVIHHRPVERGSQ
jgi:hypothetical protein